jgi:hypothetical protein
VELGALVRRGDRVARPLDQAVTRRAARLAAAGLCVVGACTRGSEPHGGAPEAAPVVRELATPAAPGSLGPSLLATGGGRLLLSWVEPRGEGRHALRFAERAKGAPWSEPLTVAEGSGWFVNWADFPHLAALEDGTLFAHWLEKRPGGGTYDYDVRVTRSRDAGRRWDPPFAPYRDESAGEHGFVALAPLDAARMGILFLDGRETKRADGAMTLRFTSLSRAAPPEPDVRLDDRVCDCCQTALARTSRGLVAAYRDRSPDEVRDIAVVRLESGRWTAPVIPAADGWQIHACPVNGPALAAAGERVALAWFTMAGEAPRVKLAFSDDAGASWGPPQVVDDGQPIGRVDVVLPRGPAGGRGDGSAVVSWLEQTENGASLRLRRVGSGPTASASVSLAGTSAARSSGFPRLAAADGELVVAWRDASDPGRLVTALVELP